MIHNYDYFKISHKGFILVAVPLIFSLLFVGILSLTLLDAEYQIREEQRNREIVSHMNNLATFGLDAAQALISYKSSRDAAKIQQFDAQVKQVLEEFRDLKAKVRNEKDLHKVEELERVARIAAAVLDKCKVELAEGDRMAVLKYGPTLVACGRKVKEGFGEIVGPYRQEEEQHLSGHKRARQWIWTSLILCVFVSVAIALILARFFSKGITNRLRTLTDNSLRLAKGLPLNPVLEGVDEIASLDKDFHLMADELAAAMSKLRASEERTRLVIEHMPVGVVTVDPRGKIESINPRTEEIFACRSADLVGKNLAVIFPQMKEGKGAPTVTGEFPKAIGKPVDADAKRISGENFPAEVSVNKFQTLEGDRYLVNVQDVTERHEIERLKQEFVAMVSHDLRAPLTAVQGTLTLLQEGTYGDLNQIGVKRVEAAEQSIDRLINLINDLLDIEKLEAGKLTMRSKATPLSDVIERSLDAVRVFAEQNNVSLESLPTELKVTADGDRLVQVLVNLLSNAVKFSPKGSTVIVSTHELTGQVEVRVTDQGRGVPAAFRDSIFERFKQVEAADGAPKKGTGLGLAICKAIVEAHQGSIGVESEDGKGSTFWFRVPI